MPVVRAGGDELRERQLVQRAGRPVAHPLGLGHLAHQRLRDHHPAQPQPRCHGLAGRAEVHDAFRVESLEGADRLAVVAELPVVVVLQDQAAGAPGPVDRRGPPVGVERHPRRELVRGCQQHRAGAPHRGQFAGPGAEFVERQAGDAQPGLDKQTGVHVEPVRLDGDLAHAALPQHLPHHHQSVDEARADDDAFGVRVHTAGA